MQPKLKMKKLTALAALVPALLGWSAAPVQNTPPPAKPAAEQPTGREIVDRFVKVTGTDALVEKTSSIYVSGKVEAMGMKGSFERYAAKPTMSLMKMSMEGLGATAVGFDGTTAWMTNPMLSPMV